MIGETDAGRQFVPAEGKRTSAAAAAVLDGGRATGGAVSILLVLDRADEAARIAGALSCCRDVRFAVDHVSDRDEARRLWREGFHDIAVCDVWLGRGTSIDLMTSLAEQAASRPVVVLSNLPALEARAITGADCDFLVHSKENLSPAALAMTLCSALALARRMAVTLYA